MRVCFRSIAVVAFGPTVIGLAAAPAIGAESGTRSDVPIVQTLNSDGARRYAVWVRVGERTVEALLDTGSTGLRVLPSVVPGDLAGPTVDPIFGGSLHMGGVVVERDVEIGALHGALPVQVVDRIDCVEAHPDCDAALMSSDTYLIGGDGIPAQGYSAILGIGFTTPGRDLPNPLERLGAKRWIVDLPRPFEDGPGHLVIAPTAEESGAFTRLLLDKGGDTVPGCLKAEDQNSLICGSTLLDTGAPLLAVSTSEVKSARVWATGTKGTLRLKTLGASLTLPFEVGAEQGPAQVVVAPAATPRQIEPTLNAGLFPFFGYDMLYDAALHAIGVKARPIEPPRAQPEPKQEAVADGKER